MNSRTSAIAYTTARKKGWHPRPRSRAPDSVVRHKSHTLVYASYAAARTLVYSPGLHLHAHIRNLFILFKQTSPGKHQTYEGDASMNDQAKKGRICVRHIVIARTSGSDGQVAVHGSSE
jgi:hypothetical protein